MKVCTLYLLVIGWTVPNRRAGGGADAQSDDVSAAVTSSPTTTPPDYSDCAGYLPHVKDGYCDNVNNNADCGYDGGDCCECTCVDGPSQSCGELGVGYDCIDPDVPEGCGITPSPAASFGYPDCTGYIYDLQDGYCNDDLNNAECGYDGGDCCRCTCRNYSPYDDTAVAFYYDNCGSNGYDCQDPVSPTDCDFETDSPTPSPTVNADYPYCTGIISSISNGFCESYNNIAECGYDGGDCCPCTCVDGIYFCGSYYDCVDPGAKCVGTTSTDDSFYGYSYYPYTNIPIPTSTDDDSYTAPRETRTTSTGDDSYSAFSDDDACLGRQHGGNGFCNSEYNTLECDYDGGDCCECTCVSSSFDCGVGGYSCFDPTCDYFSTSDSAGFGAEATSGEASSASSSSSKTVFGLVLVGVLGFCCAGGLIAIGGCTAICKRGVYEPTGGSNYAVQAAPPAPSGPPHRVHLPPTAPTREEAKAAEPYFDQESNQAGASYDEYQIESSLRENERRMARSEQRQIAAAVYRKSMREQTIADTMYEEIARVPTNVDQSKADRVPTEQQRVSAIDADTVGADEYEMAEAGKTAASKTGLAVTRTGRNDVDHGKIRHTRNTDDVTADDGTALADTSGDEGDRATKTGQPQATIRVDVPGNEESVVVGEVSHDTCEPAGDCREDCSDVKDVVVETGTSIVVVSGEENQGSGANAVEETDKMEPTFEEAGDEGCSTYPERSSDNTEAGREESGVVEGKVEMIGHEEATEGVDGTKDPSE